VWDHGTDVAQRMETAIRTAGFENVHIEILEMGPGSHGMRAWPDTCGSRGTRREAKRMSLWLMIFGGAPPLMSGAAHHFPDAAPWWPAIQRAFARQIRVLTGWSEKADMTLMSSGLLVLLGACPPSVAVEHSARLAGRAPLRRDAGRLWQ